jgi:hypothetical protein
LKLFLNVSPIIYFIDLFTLNKSVNVLIESIIYTPLSSENIYSISIINSFIYSILILSPNYSNNNDNPFNDISPNGLLFLF